MEVSAIVLPFRVCKLQDIAGEKKSLLFLSVHCQNCWTALHFLLSELLKSSWSTKGFQFHHSIRISNWRHTIVDGTEFLINYQWLRLLREASYWQLNQNSAPSTVWDVNMTFDILCIFFSPVHVVLVSLLVDQLSGLFLILFGGPKKNCPVSGNFWSVSDFFWSGSDFFVQPCLKIGIWYQTKRLTKTTWTGLVRKNCSSYQQKKWNSRLKAENLQIFWDH